MEASYRVVPRQRTSRSKTTIPYGAYSSGLQKSVTFDIYVTSTRVHVGFPVSGQLPVPDMWQGLFYWDNTKIPGMVI